MKNLSIKLSKAKVHKFNSSGYCINGCGEHFTNCNEGCCVEYE